MSNHEGHKFVDLPDGRSTHILCDCGKAFTLTYKGTRVVEEDELTN